MLLVDPVVDNRDLDAITLRSGQLRELGRADDGWPTVEVEVVREARVDPRSDPARHECRELTVRDADREAVDEYLVPPRDNGRRYEIVDARDRPRLLGLESAHVRAREGRVDVQLAVHAEAGEAARVGRGGQGRVGERHDDPHAVAAVVLDPREVRCRANLEERPLDHAARRPIDGAGRRPGGRDDGEK